MGRPAVLIERWLPVEELSAECMRDASAARKPPLNRLHVWWARRPLAVSRAAVLGSLLPAWDDNWPAALRQRFPSEAVYRQWVLRLLGILGDPVAGRKLLEYARARNLRLPGNPYGYPRAFTVNPSEEELQTFVDLMELTWETREIAMLDPMAGGGSIPFEALRLGLTTSANELNPVACVILKATLDFPARFGSDLVGDIQKWGRLMAEQVEARLAEFFPIQDDERVFAYVWARTVACPTTGKPVPLSPNWWLRKPKDAPESTFVAVHLICEDGMDWPQFEIVRGSQARAAKPDQGTVSRGIGRSPWTGEAIPEDYIKAEAQAGRMGAILYALGIETARGRDFRLPTEADLEAVRQAEEALKERWPQWEAQGLIPTEAIPEEITDPRPLHYGMRRWCDFFSPRQLLALCTYLETLRELSDKIRRVFPKDRAEAVLTYLALALDKSADYNSRMIRWHSSRQVIAGTFDRHDFSFKWSHAEFDAARNLLPWALEQILDAYRGMARLLEPARLPLFALKGKPVVERLEVTAQNAASLAHLLPESVHVVCVDPPYYANVMYGELSDFFYVWLKRALSDVYPDLFAGELTDKDEEAVANMARFKGLPGKKARDLAEADYERKMAACFREMHRVLHPDGVLTVMFTHKEVRAWDTLASALIGAGFTVKASWPVHTESEHSLHQAKKNAAQSTILLVCRKRQDQGESVWWDDLKGQVRQIAREKAEEFAQLGIRGVDLYISTFGPVLSVISERWPVLTSEVDPKTGQPRPLRPEVALDLARAEVVALRKQGLLLGRTIQFDPVTDWYVLAWNTFRAETFPADEARKLALALGLDLEQDLVRTKRVITKKQNDVSLNPPLARRRKGLVDPERQAFDCWLDAVHTAMLLYQEDGAESCRMFLQRAGLLTDTTFKAALQALLNAIPRTKEKGKFIRPEAEILEHLRLAFFDDLVLPPEEIPPIPPAIQQALGLEEELEVEEDEVEA